METGKIGWPRVVLCFLFNMRALWASLTLWRPKTRGLALVGCQVGDGEDHLKDRVLTVYERP